MSHLLHRVVPVLLLLTLSLGCGPVGVTPPAPDGGTQDTDGGAPGEPFAAPAKTWTYVPIPESVCGNGSSTGIAVNIEPGSDELLLFLQGGGACWEAFACLYANDGQGTSTHLRHEVGEEIVLAEATTPHPLLDRDDPANPLRGSSYVYVPYCTGDLHAGDRAKAYDAGFGQFTTVHHKGAHNLALILDRLAAELPDLAHIRVAGVSAGGYGATLNWWRVREAYPEARVDVLNDSGPPIRTSGGQYGTMRAAWDLQLPPGCTDCASSMTAYLPFYADTIPAENRLALLAYDQDEVIRAFFGYALDPAGYTARLDEVFDALGPSHKMFELNGTAHVMLARDPLPSTSGGVSLLDWLTDFVDDSAQWDHAGP